MSNIEQDMEFPQFFKAWIPNISGRLSFSAFGNTTFPTRAITSNIEVNRERYLLCYQKRETIDVVLPLPKFLESIIARTFFGLDGRFWFVCIARTYLDQYFDQERLVGKLCIFWPKTTWRHENEYRIKRVQRMMNDYSQNPDFTDCKKITMLSAFERLFNEIEKYSMFNASFSTLRTGTTEISFGKENFMKNGEFFENLSRDEQIKFWRLLSAQFFYFLRDIGHRHQHHDPSSDTLVELYPLSKDNPSLWRRYTLFAIYRRVIDLKRHPNAERFDDIMGLVSYADSFHKICQQELGSKHELPVYYSENIRQSVEAVDKSFYRKHQQNQTKFSNWINVILFIVIILFSFLGLLSLANNEARPNGIAINPNPILWDVASYAAEKPIKILYALFFIKLSVQ